jgi:signal transduction histidine kinase
VASNAEQDIVLALLAELYGQVDAGFAATLLLVYDELDVAEMIATTNPQTAIPLHTKFDLKDFPTSELWRKSDQLILLGDILSSDLLDNQSKAILTSIGVKAGAWMPLAIGGRTLGLLLFTWQQTREFSPEEEQEFKSVGRLIAMMLSTMLTESQLIEKTLRLAIIDDVKRGLAQAKTDSEMLEVLTRIDALHNSAGTLMYIRCDETGKPITIEIRAQRAADGSDLGFAGLPNPPILPFDMYPSLAQFATRPEEILFIQNFATDSRTSGTPEAEFFLKMGIVSMLAVPLISKTDGLIGVVSFTWTVEHHFSPEFEQTITDIREYITALVSVRRSQIEQSIRQAELQIAEESNRNKTRFMSVVSHELRTPLTSLGMGLLLIEQSGELNEDQRQWLETLHNSSTMMQLTVEGILDYQKIVVNQEPLHPEVANVFAATSAVVDTLALQAQKAKIALIVNADEAVRSLRMSLDVRSWHKVVNNLLTNAYKYTPEGGTITLTMELLEDNLRVVVADTGIGIKPELVGRIFDDYVQGDGKPIRKFAGSLGLGLSIVRSVISQMRGTITVESTLGQGTMFTLVIPTSS